MAFNPHTEERSKPHWLIHVHMLMHAHLHTSALIQGEQEVIEVLNTTHTNRKADDLFLFSNYVRQCKCMKAAKLTEQISTKTIL